MLMPYQQRATYVPDKKFERDLVLIRDMMNKKKEVGSPAEKKYDYYDRQPESNEEKNAVLFSFDPNSISISDWIKLGIPERTIHTIQK